MTVEFRSAHFTLNEINTSARVVPGQRRGHGIARGIEQNACLCHPCHPDAASPAPRWPILVLGEGNKNLPNSVGQQARIDLRLSTPMLPRGGQSALGKDLAREINCKGFDAGRAHVDAYDDIEHHPSLRTFTTIDLRA
jgi:hypothetical protein